MRIGLVGYNCRTGLGELNRQIAVYGDIARWLCVPHPKLQNNMTFYGVDAEYCIDGSLRQIEKFVDSVDVVLFCERPFYRSLVDFVKDRNKRLVCVPMLEWTPVSEEWTSKIDLFICPTKQCYKGLSKTLPCVYFPWPVDVDRFVFTKRKTCNRFLFIGGHGGWRGRKGADVVERCVAYWPEMPLTIISQAPTLSSGLAVKVLEEVPHNYELYDNGDVLIAPHKVDGLGLEPMEAMASGMPVITTCGAPWGEIPAIACIHASKHVRVVNRPVDWYEPVAESLLSMCRSWIGRDISVQSLEAREWAESRSWAKHAAVFRGLVMGAVT